MKLRTPLLFLGAVQKLIMNLCVHSLIFQQGVIVVIEPLGYLLLFEMPKAVGFHFCKGN